MAVPFSAILAVIIIFFLQKIVLDIWFSKKLFKGTWAKYAKMNDQQMADIAKSKVLHEAEIPSRAIHSIFLVFFLGVLGATDPLTGIAYAVLLWLGFVETHRLIAYAWAQKDIRLWLVEAGAEGVIAVSAGAIAGALLK